MKTKATSKIPGRVPDGIRSTHTDIKSFLPGSSGPEPTSTSSGSRKNVTSSNTKNENVPFQPTRTAHTRINEVPSVQTSFDSSGKGGAAFRPISETFEVNPANGTFSLSIPIKTSPARSGFNLNLALSYDSGNGNGPFGFGWALTIPEVYRRTDKGIPRYNEDSIDPLQDSFALSGGDELICVESLSLAGYNVSRYRPRVEKEHLRIERWVRIADVQDVHWRTISTDNITTIFGDNDASRIFDLNYSRKRIFAWRISYKYDSFGNAVLYNYWAEDGVGVPENSWEINRCNENRCRQRYIKSICYGNLKPNRNMETWEVSSPSPDWMFEVVFDYGNDSTNDISNATPASFTLPETWATRRDAFSVHHAGFELRTYRICKRIDMIHHFPEELGKPNHVVSSTVLDYEESERATFLKTITRCGPSPIKAFDEENATEPLPPWTFSYSQLPDPTKLELKRTNTSSLYALPSSQHESAEWIDLEGEGMPGLLIRSKDGTWSYQRNMNPLTPEGDGSSFSPLSLLSSLPSLSDEKSYLDDLDGSGRKSLVTLNSTGQVQGFYDREDEDSWANFHPFSALVTTNLLSSDVFRVDLTGDGLLDILHAQTDPGTIEWQPSLAKRGFAQRQLAHSATQTICLSSVSNKHIRTYFLDMTGDGYSDIVRIGNGMITYWPNLGYGCFGDEVKMGNAPFIHEGDQFTHSRIRLLDLDGSGTTDMLYIMPGGTVDVYYNLAGNQWSKAIALGPFPELSSSSNLSVVDLFGNGTGCLCWTEPSMSADQPGTLHYLDVMASRKPHILTKYANGMGTDTAISYLPSTHFYLYDQRNSQRWRTKIPFPVQCVASVVSRDIITGLSKSSTYTYHDGYYDGAEKEFGGFGMVEVCEEERIPVGPGEVYTPPPVITKYWFNNGSHAELSFSDEVCCSQRLFNTISPQVLPHHLAEAYRSLRGQLMRTEVYSKDGTANEASPLRVTESSYTVRQIFAPSESNSGAFEALLRDSIAWHYERDMTDPRIEHTMIVNNNSFGDIIQQVQVFYGRNHAIAAEGMMISEEEILRHQSQTRIICSDALYTNAIDQSQEYLKPISWSTRQYEITADVSHKLLDTADLRKLGIANNSDSHFSSPPVGALLISEDRTYFLANDLVSVLPAGTLEAYSVQSQTFQLYIDRGGDDDLFKENVKDLLQIDHQTFMTRHGYRRLGSDLSWWVPSSRSIFSDSSSMSAHDYLQCARRSFYLPTLVVDPFGNATRVEMDQYCLLPVCTTDALSNMVQITNDYVHLKPIRIVDPNQNIEEVRLNAYGSVIAVARRGKEHEHVGDSLSDFKWCNPATVVDDLLEDPVGPLSQALLGRAASRTLIDLSWRTQTTQSGVNVRRPPVTVHIYRDTSYSLETNIKLCVTWLDGHGKANQELQLVDSSAASKRWYVKNYSVVNTTGYPLRTFQSFFVEKAEYLPVSKLKAHRCTYLYDPLGRPIGLVNSDCTWSKTSYTPWSTQTWDLGDTVLMPGPDVDPDIGSIVRTWRSLVDLSPWYRSQMKSGGLNKIAAEASETYNDTPHTSYIDPSGRVIVSMSRSEKKAYTEFAEYDVWGNIIKRIDRLGRVTERHVFDNLGRCLQSSGMDRGISISRYNCVDNPVLLGIPSRGIWASTTYDALHRELEIFMSKHKSPLRVNKKIVYGESRVDSEKYNLKNQVWQIFDQAGLHCNLQFDHRGNPVENSTQFAKVYKGIIYWDEDIELRPEIYKQRSSFDYTGRVTWSEDAMGNQTKSTWDKTGNLVTTEHSRHSLSEQSERSWQPYIKSILYTADSLPLETHYGNGTTVFSKFDEHTRLVVQETTSGSAGNVIDDVSFVYDCEGRVVCSTRLSDEQSFFKNCIIKPESQFRYDALGRLISATGRQSLRPNDFAMQAPTAANTGDNGDTIGDGSRMCAYRETYSYDAAGNITSMRHEPQADGSISGWTRTYYYEEQSFLEDTRCNNMLSRTVVGDKEEIYKYDSSAGSMGCMTSMPGFPVLQYNCQGMLAASTTTRQSKGTPETTYYIYNHEGERMRKITEFANPSSDNESPQSVLKETIFLPGLELFYKYKKNTDEPDTQRYTSFVQGDRRIAAVEQTATSLAPLVRYSYGSKMELDDQGQLISYEEHSPFGAVTYAARRADVTAPRSYRFAGYQRDSETGLLYCQARYYAGWLGRFTTTDPLGSIDDQNLYQYCLNDPINFFDPTGMIIANTAARTTVDRRPTSTNRRPSPIRAFPHFQNTNQATAPRENILRPTRPLGPNPNQSRPPSTQQRALSVGRRVSIEHQAPVEQRANYPRINNDLNRAIDRVNDKSVGLYEAIGSHESVMKAYTKTLAKADPTTRDALGLLQIPDARRNLTTADERATMGEVRQGFYNLGRFKDTVLDNLPDDGTLASDLQYVEAGSKFVKQATSLNRQALNLYDNMSNPGTQKNIEKATNHLNESTTNLLDAKSSATRAVKNLEKVRMASGYNGGP